MTPYRIARWLVFARNLSVIPLLGKVAWKKFQQALPSDNELRQWFDDGPYRNIGIVTGRSFACDREIEISRTSGNTLSRSLTRLF
jgi:hypothetical protein